MTLTISQRYCQVLAPHEEKQLHVNTQASCQIVLQNMSIVLMNCGSCWKNSWELKSTKNVSQRKERLQWHLGLYI